MKQPYILKFYGQDHTGEYDVFLDEDVQWLEPEDIPKLKEGNNSCLWVDIEPLCSPN